MKVDPNDLVDSWNNDCSMSNGLTKREYFAAMALSGVEGANIVNRDYEILNIKEVAIRAVRLADALIAELNRK